MTGPPRLLLVAKARALQERRGVSPGFSYYWRTQYHRQLIFLSLYAAVSGALYLIGWPIMAAVFLGFAIGRTWRDVQWYRTLGREWETTSELLDWPKIEELASERRWDPQAKDEDS